MKSTPNTIHEALVYAQREWKHPSRDWHNDCQMFCRSCYGMGGGFASAYAQWEGAPAHLKVVGGNPNKAPVGALLCYKGSGKYGHIMLAKHPFPNGTAAAWSTDLWKNGKVGPVSRTAPITEWNQKYLGYIKTINGAAIPFPHA